MNQPRRASESDRFPYAASTVCYIEVQGGGRTTWGPPTADGLARVRDDGSQLFAVWPGQWASQLFVIDDLEACAAARGLPSPSGSDHVHDIRWAPSRCDTERSAHVEVQLLCGCEVRSIHLFASQARALLGWNVYTSVGWGGGGRPGGLQTYSFSVQRSTLGGDASGACRVASIDRG